MHEFRGHNIRPNTYNKLNKKKPVKARLKAETAQHTKTKRQTKPQNSTAY